MRKMKANKIIATLVVMTMLLSMPVVFNQLEMNTVAATRGVDIWGNATTDLYYMQGGDSGTTINFNTSALAGSTTYYLFKPRYNCSTAAIPENFEWDPDPATRVTGPIVTFETAADPVNKIVNLGAIKLDRAGIWMIGTDSTTYGDYFWVNTSKAYTIDAISDITFGENVSKTITVKEGDSAVACFVDLIDPEGNLVFHEWTDTPGSYTFYTGDYIEMTGEYKVLAYRDFDLHKIMYQYGTDGYDDTHGQGWTVSGYDYDVVGPWDPPEKNATEITFNVKTAKPNIVLTNTTVFWGQAVRIDINVTGADGKGINVSSPGDAIKLRFGKYIDDTYFNLYYGKNPGDYYIFIDSWMPDPSDWINLATGAAAINDNINGTWRVVFGYDSFGTIEEEYNNSASFTISRSDPPVRIVIVDPANKKIDVPAYSHTVPYTAGTETISFDIFGTSVSDVDGRAYYGDDLIDYGEDYKNITITGDLLYPVDAEYVGPAGRWKADVTPLKPGGTITITINWQGAKNGTASQTIDIIDGLHIIPAVEKFTVGNHYNLTVSIKDTDGTSPVSRAKVWLIWEPDDDTPDGASIIDGKIGNNSVGLGRNGEYTFWIKKDNQSYAPRKLTIAAEIIEGGDVWGYATVTMVRNHNMNVDVTPTTSYAGDATEYDITVTLLEGGNPAKTDLNVKLYNETGALVEGIDAWSKAGEHTITDAEIPLSAGTYYLFAYNKTHDSEGNNATIVVTPYTITSAPSVLAWLVDTAVNMTFQVTPTINGTLLLKNVSGAEAAIESQEVILFIEDGIGTLNEVNATTLGNVTFEFTPETGYQRPAEGLLRVTTATATPNPSTIYLGEPTVVTITITHPATGTPLKDVKVGLDINESMSSVLVKRPTSATTDAQGQVTFAVTAEASGNVTIYIQNESDPDNMFIIKAAARKPMTISHSPSVNEGTTFTVEAKSNGVLITEATVIFTFDGQTWPTTTGVASITAPSVVTSMSYPITATAEGYLSASGSVMVINIPKLIIAIADDVKAGQSFSLTIADDKGGPVIGATITFEGTTYTSGAGGVLTMTAPSKAGSYPITASFPGYETITTTVTVGEGPGIPGFELLTLIAAIGVAFLLLRRRRK
jgi:hypothetical protein